MNPREYVQIWDKARGESINFRDNEDESLMGLPLLNKL
jgi:hypothetical protein